MSEFIGKQFINGQRVAENTPSLHSINATTYKPTGYSFCQATLDEVNKAAQAAHDAFKVFNQTTLELRAQFLEEIAIQIEAIGSQ